MPQPPQQQDIDVLVRDAVVPQRAGDAPGGVFGVPWLLPRPYALFANALSRGQQNGLNSSQLGFPTTPATRKAGDSRKSVQELYGSKAAYVDAVNRAVDQLVAEGFILKAGTGGVDDPAEYLNRA